MPEFVAQATWVPDALLWWFAETTVVVSALAVLAALASRVPRVTPGPAARHALWLLVMLKLMTPPVVHWPWSGPPTIAVVRLDASRSWSEIATPSPDGSARGIAGDTGDERPPAAIPTASNGPGGVGSEPKTWDEIPTPKPDPRIEPPSLAPPRFLGAWVASTWLLGSIVLGAGQARRVRRFRRLLLGATPAPAWLTEEAERVGRRLAVRVPAILVVPRLGTPVLWCLGRPVILVPDALLRALEPGRWRAVVAHELAHLRRGDHWVRRLELAAGLVWWWNPLYWLARRRLEFEAELACDAWAVWASPGGRISYAESLLRICTALSPTESPAPALGVAGNGRSFERRLRMILHDRVDRRISASGLFAAAVLACLALPSWTTAGPTRISDDKSSRVATRDEPIVRETRSPDVVTATVPIVTEVVEVVTRDDQADDESDDAASPQEAKAKQAKLKAEQDALQKKQSAVAGEMEKKFGPGSEFAKKMEAMGKEMEEKFGPGSEFAKKMESLGKEMEERFGPGSEFAKDMAKKFGPDSDFAKDMQKKFGPDSDFARDMQKQFGPGSEFARRGKDGAGEQGEADARSEARNAKLKAETRARAEADRARAEAQRARSEAQKEKLKAEAKDKAEARAKQATSPDRRARRIEALESRLEELMQELKRLKAEENSDKQEDSR